MVGLNKMGCIKKMVLGGSLLKVQFDFQENLFFFGNVSFQFEIFYVTNFKLVLVVCNVQLVIFINKYLVNLFRISFCELLMILILNFLNMLDKLCLFFLEVINNLI